MREGTTPQMLDAIGAPTITTAIAARLEFKSETITVWTGAHSIIPQGSGDSLLDGSTFDSLSNEIVDIGENTFSYSGSSEMTVTLNIPSSPDIAIAASQTYPNEYQGRPATLWRAIMVPQTDPAAKPIWLFRRIRTGSMDRVEIQADGQSHKFILTIESHQGKISNASNQSYLNQRDFDPNDASQDAAPSIANGDPAPTKAAIVTSRGEYGYGSDADKGYYNRQIE